MPTRELLAACRAVARRCFRDGDAQAPIPDRADDGAGADGMEADAAFYLAHAVGGAPMRRLAEAAGRHPSSVLRAVRRMETRREDPLLDDLLRMIEAAAEISRSGRITFKETALPHHARDEAARSAEGREDDRPGARKSLEREGRRILRRLGEPGAFLALARGAEVAVVFRKGAEGLVTLARVALADARGFAARDWIACEHRGPGMARYGITSAGRAWLKRALAADAEARAKARGFAEAASPFARQHQEAGERLFADEKGGAKKRRVNLGETPLGWLARRRGPGGEPFLTPWEVAAGERLREDFERARMGPRVAQDWARFLAPAPSSGGGAGGRGPAEGPEAAREKVRAALDAIGPGLNDAVLRACCFLEGLEATERRMGWSARSGKVVLKIALGRLAEHYGLSGEKAPRARRRGEGEKDEPPPLRRAG